MNDKFEEIPNEILIDIFQYFDARELFQIFYNLNSRFNIVIKSFHHLNLLFRLKLFSDNQIDPKHLFPYYVQTLFVGPNININLNQFLNIDSLKLDCPLARVLAQFDSDMLPHLKHLTITRFDTTTTIDEWTLLPLLESFKVSRITSIVYQTILQLCPNLTDLQLSMFSSDELKSDFKKHLNLKRLTIDIADMIWPWSDHVFDSYLSCVPNLEKFIVCRSIFILQLPIFPLEYDWLAAKILLYLPSIHQFKFFFNIIQDPLLTGVKTENFFCEIKEVFKQKHNKSYQSQLIIC